MSLRLQAGKERNVKMEENSSISFWKIAVTILLAAILIGVVFLIARQGKSVVNEKLEVINHAISENQSDGYLIYENTKISGNEVMSVIKKAVDNKDSVCIRVITGMNQTSNSSKWTDYNYKGEETTGSFQITPISAAVNKPIPNAEGRVTDENYVNPTGMFQCEVKRDANGTLVALIFTQE